MSQDYRHIDKDPIIDLIRTVAQDYNGGEITGKFIESLAYDVGCSPSTLRNWFYGETRRPQHLTVKFVLEALDCKLKVVRKDGSEVRGSRHAKVQTHRRPAKMSSAVGAAA